MESFRSMPLGARIEHIDKMRKRRKKMMKENKTQNMDAFNFFFNNKETIPLPSAAVNLIQPKLRRSKTSLNRSFDNIKSVKRQSSIATFKTPIFRRNTIAPSSKSSGNRLQSQERLKLDETFSQISEQDSMVSQSISEDDDEESFLQLTKSKKDSNKLDTQIQKQQTIKKSIPNPPLLNQPSSPGFQGFRSPTLRVNVNLLSAVREK